MSIGVSSAAKLPGYKFIEASLTTTSTANQTLLSVAGPCVFYGCDSGTLPGGVIVEDGSNSLIGFYYPATNISYVYQSAGLGAYGYTDGYFTINAGENLIVSNGSAASGTTFTVYYGTAI